MDTAINTAIDTAVDGIVALFTTNLPVVFAVVGSLIGLGLAYKLVKRFIGKKMV